MPGNYQMPWQGCYHQILSSCPTVHLQRQPKWLTGDIHWQWTHFRNMITKMKNKATQLDNYLAFTIASTVFFSCALNCPRSVSTLLVTCNSLTILNINSFDMLSHEFLADGQPQYNQITPVCCWANKISRFLSSSIWKLQWQLNQIPSGKIWINALKNSC